MLTVTEQDCQMKAESSVTLLTVLEGQLDQVDTQRVFGSFPNPGLVTHQVDCQMVTPLLHLLACQCLIHLKAVTKSASNTPVGSNKISI